MKCQGKSREKKRGRASGPSLDIRKELDKLPVLITPTQAKRLLGRVSRDLENVVMFDPKKRTLFRREQVRELIFGH